MIFEANSLRSAKSTSNSILYDEPVGAARLCCAFPSVRHATTNASDTGFFETSTSSFDNMTLPAPVDNWKDLEILVIDCITGRWLNKRNYNHLVRWLTRRRESGQPLLHVKLVAQDANELRDDLELFFHAYNALQACCSLELVNIPLLHYYWLPLVRFLFLNSQVANSCSRQDLCLHYNTDDEFREEIAKLTLPWPPGSIHGQNNGSGVVTIRRNTW